MKQTKEERAAYCKKWRKNNKEHVKRYAKQYNEDHKQEEEEEEWQESCSIPGQVGRK